MSENSNYDAIALKREERRRKILQNADSRLGRITGRINSPSDEKPKPNNVFHNLQNDIHMENPFDSLNEKNFSEEMMLKNLTDLKKIHPNSEFLLSSQQDPEKMPHLELIVQKRLHYILLSVIVHVLLHYKLGSVFYNNIFCPFITVKLLECTLIKQTSEPPPIIIYVLCILPIVSRHQIFPYIIKVYCILKNFFSDFFLYIFVFVTSDKLVNVINEFYFIN